MILDKNAMFFNAVDQASAPWIVGNNLSDAFDTGAPGTPGGKTVALGHNWGKGKPLTVECIVTTDFASGGAATLIMQLVQADNSALSTNLEVLAASQSIALASLVRGFRPIGITFFPPMITRRWIGMRAVVGTAVYTAGVLSAGIVMDLQTAPL